MTSLLNLAPKDGGTETLNSPTKEEPELVIAKRAASIGMSKRNSGVSPFALARDRKRLPVASPHNSTMRSGGRENLEQMLVRKLRLKYIDNNTAFSTKQPVTTVELLSLNATGP